MTSIKFTIDSELHKWEVKDRTFFMQHGCINKKKAGRFLERKITELNYQYLIKHDMIKIRDTNKIKDHNAHKE